MRSNTNILPLLVRSVISILLGIIICEVGVAIANESHTVAGIDKYTSNGSVNDSFIFLQLALLFIFYVASGFITASITKFARFGHVAIVVAVTLGLLYFYSLNPESIQVWYYPARVCILLAGILCGLTLALRHQENVQTDA